MAKYKIVMTDRDEKILYLLKKFGYIREDYLAKYLGLDYNLDTVRNVLHKLAGRLKKHDIVNREKIIIGKTFYWWLARGGADFVDTSVLKKISLVTLNHNDLVAELAINYLVNNHNINLKTEFEIKQELYGVDAKERKIPDLILDDRIAIEVELSKKNNKKLVNIVSNYLRADYTEIIYYIDSKSIANSLYKISNKNDKFKYKLFDKSILLAINYNPNLDTDDDFLRDDKNGRFISTAEDKIKQLFGN